MLSLSNGATIKSIKLSAEDNGGFYGTVLARTTSDIEWVTWRVTFTPGSTEGDCYSGNYYRDDWYGGKDGALIEAYKDYSTR